MKNWCRPLVAIERANCSCPAQYVDEKALPDGQGCKCKAQIINCKDGEANSCLCCVRMSCHSETQASGPGGSSSETGPMLPEFKWPKMPDFQELFKNFFGEQMEENKTYGH